jgi:hypothetical protein
MHLSCYSNIVVSLVSRVQSILTYLTCQAKQSADSAPRWPPRRFSHTLTLAGAAAQFRSHVCPVMVEALGIPGRSARAGLPGSGRRTPVRKASAGEDHERRNGACPYFCPLFSPQREAGGQLPFSGDDGASPREWAGSGPGTGNYAQLSCCRRARSGSWPARQEATVPHPSARRARRLLISNLKPPIPDGIGQAHSHPARLQWQEGSRLRAAKAKAWRLRAQGGPCRAG